VTVHVISVGVSVLDALAAPYRTLAGHDELLSAVARAKPHDLLTAQGIGKGDRGEASSWLAAALAPVGDTGRDPQKVQALSDVSQAVRPGSWPHDISAELDTFARLPQPRLPLSAGDIAILVCSDTPEGLLAGLWNAVALTEGDLYRVRYLASPGTRPGPVRGAAVVVRVPGMDAADGSGFRQAMGGLGTLGRNLLRSGDLAKDEPFRFYLSGGFKAAVPYLIGLAEGLRSCDPRRSVEAVVLHETALKGAPPIQLPLRHLIPDQIQDELSGFDGHGIRASLPTPALLNGYAYEIRGGKCYLTAFGEGLRALFGVGPEWLGG
jgi:hypothetical protein